MSYKLFNAVIFSITNQCNAQCHFCIQQCNICQETKNLDEEVICGAIKQLERIHNIQTIGFTGGEPFLDYDRLKRLICLVNQIKKKSVVYTNGFWCKDLETTKNRLETLKDLGLQTILTSIDSEHQKFVPIERIKNLLVVCKKIGMEVRVHSILQKSSINATISILQELAEELIGICVTTSSVMLLGSAEKNVSKDDTFPTIDINNVSCGFGRLSYVDVSGNVYPCCAGDTSKKLCLGNIYNESLVDCLSRTFENLYFKNILKKGLQWMMGVAGQNGVIDIYQKYTSECEICKKIFSADEKDFKWDSFIEL